ncbi:MAG: hypothetical protein AAGC46_01590 [Solirubrobacteraceae bacterium]
MNTPIRRPSTIKAVAAVAAAMASGGLASTAAAAGATPPASTPSTTTPLRFDVHGSAQVRTGIRGTVAIDGTFDGTLDRSTGTFSGAFTLTPTVAHVVVLGLVPADADTTWLFTEPVTGTWRDGVLTLHAAAKIRHPRLVAFGHVIAGGPTCSTTRPSVLDLRSDPASPVADPAAGATLTTRGQGFAISALSGCGWLDGALSAIAAGTGNQATLTLSRPQVG